MRPLRCRSILFGLAETKIGLSLQRIHDHKPSWFYVYKSSLCIQVFINCNNEKHWNCTFCCFLIYYQEKYLSVPGNKSILTGTITAVFLDKTLAFSILLIILTEIMTQAKRN